MDKSLRKRIFNKPYPSSHLHRYEFRVAWGGVPHPEKAFKGGQDAIFASKNALVVADGVSGWSKLGIDPSIYSRKLVSHVKQLLEGKNQMFYIQHPDELAIKAVQLTEEKGSSTLTIITLHPQTGVVRTYHVGDSLYGVFRRNGSYILAEEQQKQFDMPFQVYGGALNSQDLLQRGEHLVSDVFRGDYNQFSNTEIGGSSILVASDGLWDNLHLKQIHNALLLQNMDLKEKARFLLQQTVYYSSLSEYASPYYFKGIQRGLQVQKAGKLDDVSLIIAEVITIQL